MTNQDALSPLQQAIETLGGPSAAARFLNITPQAVGQWRRAPAERVLEIERVSGVPRHELRPDLYPSPEAAA